MYDNQSRGISYTGGFFMLIAFAAVGIFLASFISVQVWQQMTGLPYSEMQKNLANPTYANALKLMQTITAVLGFLLPSIAAATLLSYKPMGLLGFSRTIKPEQMGLVLLIVAVSLIVSTSLSYFNYNIPISEAWRIKFEKMENDYNRQVEAIINLKTTKDYVLALIIMAFLPALCEETFFRGGLQNFLSRGTRKPWLAIIVVSILFSLAHFSFYGFLYRMFLGIVLGAIYYYSGRLWLNILAHFINNAIALTFLYINIQNGKPFKEAMRTEATGYWGFLALPVLIALFFLFQRTSGNKRRLA